MSPLTHEGLTVDQAVAVWNIYRKYLPGDVDIRVADVTPVRSVYEYIDNEADVGEDLHLILGEKDIEGGRFKTAADRRDGVKVQEVPIPPQMGGVSATQMRAALRDDDDITFIAGLPTELNDTDLNDIMMVLDNGLEEISVGGAVSGPSGPSFRRRRRREGHEAGGYRNPGLGIPDVQYRNEGAKNEQLVNEVVDYLLGITVG